MLQGKNQFKGYPRNGGKSFIEQLADDIHNLVEINEEIKNEDEKDHPKAVF